jgi:hypothetical protein
VFDEILSIVIVKSKNFVALMIQKMGITIAHVYIYSLYSVISILHKLSLVYTSGLTRTYNTLFAVYVLYADYCSVELKCTI